MLSSRFLSLQLALRYVRSKKQQRFISFISFASLIGIALGVMVLITVLSVMNGFDYEIKHKLFNLADQVLVTRDSGRLPNWQAAANRIKAESSQITAVAPLIRAQGLLSQAGRSAPVMISGILPALENKVSSLSNYLEQGSFASLKAGSYHVVVGEGLALNLGLMLGSKVLLITPQASASPLGVMPRYRVFTVSGIYRVASDPVLNNNSAFIALGDAQRLYQYGSSITALRFRVNNLYAAPAVSHRLSETLSDHYLVSDWTMQYGAFFKAIAMEKTMMFIILLLIVAVAAFNLVSTLVMLVNDKRSEIAILRTFGATPRFIMLIFMWQGLWIGLLGSLIGLLAGIALSLNVTRIVDGLQSLLHTHFISSSVYLINYVPSRLAVSDLWHVALATVLLSFLATLYPARQAAKTEPQEALRYE